MTAWTCEVCGHVLGTPPTAAVAMQQLEGLESTALEVPALPGLAADVTPGLEPTRAPPVPLVPGEVPVGWEAGAGLTPDVPAGGLVDLDRGRDETLDAPTLVPLSVTCRYCRNVQMDGLLCDRCGMRLPVYQPPRAETSTTAPDARVRCRRCGERSPADMPRCGACGGVLTADAP